MKIFFFNIQSGTLAVIAVAAVFLVTVIFGYNNGKTQSRAEAGLRQAMEIQKFLQYFYNDQDRFPAAQEFADENIQLAYLSSLLTNVPNNKICSSNFYYERISDQSYRFSFCLPANAGTYVKGWNKVVVQN